MSEDTAAALKAQFSDLLTGLSPEQAINVLLRFVQTAFDYQTDADNYGRENYLFAQETLTAAASDCEDRVALMAWLVANVLELPAIALLYPNHLSFAVYIPGKQDGDMVAWQNRSYTIADPTYVNANAGATMPQFRGVQPTVVPF